MKSEYTMSRGQLARRVYDDNREFRSIQEPIFDLMIKICGAELVREQRGRIGDDYTATYFISPEAICVDFKACISVDVSIFGSTTESFQQVQKKLSKLLEDRI